MPQDTVLICERDSGLRGAYELALSRERDRYKLVLADDPVRLPDLLRQHPDVRVLAWDLDHVAGRLPQTLDQLRRGRLPLHEAPLFAAREVLATLRAIRDVRPELRILLVAHEFSEAFQTDAIRAFGLLGFLNHPWSLSTTATRIRELLDGSSSSIRHWVVRIPVAP
ncbi:MAG: hypothetical protein HY600_00115 [Candidatus Omnitrophica bacterium]|nr:hypothetical protein [Candidatus Omnitrophota bacterium]